MRRLRNLLGTTVNAVMEWLNSLFGLELPVLPLEGWPQYLVDLWKRTILGALPNPTNPLPWVIPVKGNFDGLFPDAPSLAVQADIIVGEIKVGSPDIPIPRIEPAPPRKTKSAFKKKKPRIQTSHQT